MGPVGSIPHSQETATCPCPEPDQSSPCPPTPLPKDPSSYYPPIYASVFQVVFFAQVSSTKIPFFYHTLATSPTHLTLLYLNIRIILCEEYRLLSSSLCSFIHSTVISSLLGPNHEHRLPDISNRTIQA